MSVQNFRDLEVWNLSMELTGKIYEVTGDFPHEEIYGLTSQLRRAAVSILSNIAEEQGRNSTREFFHHLSISYGSLCEVETQLILAERLGFLPANRMLSIPPHCQSTGCLLNGLMRSLRAKLGKKS
jgi:four helix bundle protein